MQLRGFVGESVQQPCGLIEQVAASRDSAVLASFCQRLHVQCPGEVVAESDVRDALKLGIAVMRQRGLERFQWLVSSVNVRLSGPMFIGPVLVQAPLAGS